MQTSPTNTNYLLNGQMFDPNRIDVTMKLGSVEQWTLVNTNTEWHTFHIHVNDFQVVSVAGKRVPYIDYQDNVALPPSSQVVILIRPTDFTGQFVFHCHVTFHEDHGMMATIEVAREPSASREPPAQLCASRGSRSAPRLTGAGRAPSLGPRAHVLVQPGRCPHPTNGHERPGASPGLSGPPRGGAAPPSARAATQDGAESVRLTRRGCP